MAEALLRISGLRGLLSTPVDLDLQAGEVLCVSGASGCGKTRLLRAIADLEAFSAKIWLNGRERQRFSANEWRQQLCFVPAETAWWTEIVEDHFPALCKTEWLDTLGLTHESLQWSVSRLSSGEKQRLSLLRALSLQPKVLLLDEPTANLDEENTRNVEQLIQAYLASSQAAVMWISHDKAQRSRIASRQMLIHKQLWEII